MKVVSRRKQAFRSAESAWRDIVRRRGPTVRVRHEHTASEWRWWVPGQPAPGAPSPVPRLR